MHPRCLSTHGERIEEIRWLVNRVVVMASLWKPPGHAPCVQPATLSWPLEDRQHRVQATLRRITGAGLPDGRETLTHDEALDSAGGIRRTGSRFGKSDRRVPVALRELEEVWRQASSGCVWLRVVVV